jgi:hypothetical protein
VLNKVKNLKLMFDIKEIMMYIGNTVEQYIK